MRPFASGVFAAMLVVLSSESTLAQECPPTGCIPGEYAPEVVFITPSSTVGTRTPLIMLTFTDENDDLDMSTLQVKWNGSDVTTVGRRAGILWVWEVDDASKLSPGGSKELWARLCDEIGNCNEGSITVSLPGGNQPILSMKPMPLEALGRQYSAPFVPGFSVKGPDLEMGISTPAYFSLNTPRTAGLTYSTKQSYPRALVNVDLEFPGTAPTSLTMKLWDGSTNVYSYTFSSPNCTTGSAKICRVTLTADFLSENSYPAVRKWLKVEALATISGNVLGTVDSVEVVLVDRRTTPYGSGWWPTGVMQYVPSGDDAIIVASDGAATIYRGDGQGNFTSPPGSTVTMAEGGYQLLFKGGGSVTFDGYGRQVSVRDVNGNRDTITYVDQTVQVQKIKDPIDSAFTFTYGSGKLTKITDPGGRETTVTISSGVVTSYDFPSPGSLDYSASFTWNTFTGSAVRPATRSNTLGAATTITFQSQWAAWQADLPAVLDDSDTTGTPSWHYQPQDGLSIALLLPVTVPQTYTYLLDAEYRFPIFHLNRWGQPVRMQLETSPSGWGTWGDTLFNTYDEAGRILTSEGKVRDSTRVYYTYDTQNRLVRTHRLRPNSTMLRLDSLVYDSNDRVIQRVDPLGNVSRVDYDGNGNVIRSITPTNDTTRFTYNSRGQVTWVRRPGMTDSSKTVYGAAWGNTSEFWSAHDKRDAQNYYDAYGRLTESKGKINVKTTSDTTQMQWRRQLSFYNLANQLDSTRVERGLPCDTCHLAVWPAATDTLYWFTTRHSYNRLGLDSTRTGMSGVPTVYKYDALGRLVQRWPYGTSNPSETFKYDFWGNVRFTTTRRGKVLETRYDWRNRPDTVVVEGVGTSVYAYTGPNNELTSITGLSGYADPVGSSNVNAKWVYNQSGQVVADTVQGNRGTAYGFDTYYRDSTIADAIGTWTVVYDAQRGIATTLRTPTGDTLVYVVNSRGLMNGPSVHCGTSCETFERTQSWRTNGGLMQLTNDHGYAVGQQSFGISYGPDSLVRAWTEKNGSFAGQVAMSDSVFYDGWERVVQVQYTTGTSLTAADTFSYDTRGNVQGGGRVYNATTNRLTSDATCSSYGYDDSGNLSAKTCGSVSWTYTYDALERLTNVTNSSGDTIAYTYNVLGQRIAKEVNDTVTRFVWRSGHVLYETNGSGTITLSYTWGMSTDDLVAIHDHDSGNHYYVVQDKLRSVRGLVKRNTTWHASWRYKAYGSELATSGSSPITMRFRWAGAQYDAETGLYFLRSRYYDPSMLRFTQEDKIGFAGGGNLYAYTTDPVEARDPGGTSKDYDVQYQASYYETVTPKSGEAGSWGFANVFESWWLVFNFGVTYDEAEGLLDGSLVLTVQIRYAHLSSIDPAVTNGAAVTQGQQIGLTGSTGTKDPHLHFEVCAMNVPGVAQGSCAGTDPLAFLVFNGGTNPLEKMTTTAPFGYSNERSGFHVGVDLRARTPLPTFAAFSGTVAYAGQVEGYGNAVYINIASRSSYVFGPFAPSPGWH